MTRLSLICGVLAGLFAAPAWAVDPDICHFGTPPAGAPKSEYSETNPFLGLEQILGDIYINRALCGHDVSRDQRFWRSYYEVFGCSATSDAGRTVELWLADAPYYYARDFNTFAERYPDIAKARCERMATCKIPDRFSLTERGFVSCPKEGE